MLSLQRYFAPILNLASVATGPFLDIEARKYFQSRDIFELLGDFS